MTVAAILFWLTLQDPRADELLLRLGDESAQVRDDATRTLSAMGEDALPALRRAEAHPDPEVRARAGQLLRHIEWSPWIDPALLNRYPPLRELYLAADHEGVLAWAGRHPSWEHGFERHFEAYAIRLLDHPDLDLRKAATRALSEIEDRHDRIPKFLKMPLRNNEHVRQTLASIVEKLTGLPSRFSQGARASVRAEEPNWERDGAVTLRDALHHLECGPRHSGGHYTHLHRDGVIEICTVEEAVEHWLKRFPLTAPGSGPTRRR